MSLSVIIKTQPFTNIPKDSTIIDNIHCLELYCKQNNIEDYILDIYNIFKRSGTIIIYIRYDLRKGIKYINLHGHLS